jgi:hypothetical protein
MICLVNSDLSPNVKKRREMIEEKEEKLLTALDLSRILDVSVLAIRVRTSTGRIPPPDIRRGRRIFWKKATIENWIRGLVEKGKDRSEKGGD